MLLSIAALLIGPGAFAATRATTPKILFDDFSYTRPAHLTKNGWIIRSVAGWPGVPGASWGAAGVSFVKTGDGARVLRMTASTDGTPANTRQVQICHARKYLEGTYAARVRFTDRASRGPGGDQLVQTFYTISPLAAPMDPSYSEIDFEYLPNGGWGRKGPTLFATTWETFRPEPQWKADNVSETRQASYDGWVTLVVQVSEGKVRYFTDGKPFAEHTGHVYPESLMSLNFNLWFIRDHLAASGDPREYEQDVDWVFFVKDRVLPPADVDEMVKTLRRQRVAFRDSVPAPSPALISPCNF